jgi:fermentation-respiration switch protein FrsA (DUF1100 family)
VAEPWQDVFTYQFLQVGLPYLRGFAADGQVTTSALAAAWHGPGGLVAKELVSVLATNSFTGDFTPSPFWDADHDGAISIDREFVPGLPGFFSLQFSPTGFFRIYAPGRALPSVKDQAPFLRLPVLTLQGRNDANVPADGARDVDRALAAAGSRDHLLLALPGLGHSLGPASSPIDDDFRPIARAPLAALWLWLTVHSAVRG